MEEWFNIKNISPGTQRNYRISLRYFIKLINKQPLELIEEAEKQEAENIIPRKRNVNKYLLKYKKFLYQSKLAPSTANLYFYSIRSFYKAFDISLIDIELNSGDIGLEKNIGKPLTRKEIYQLVNVAPPRERALIYLMALSGMGQKEARNLTIRQLLYFASSAIDKKLDNVFDLFRYEEEILSEILTIEITRSKSNIRHHTFLPPEATREIITYLKERCYGRNKKIRIKNNDDTIFVNVSGKKLSRDSVVTNFRRLGLKAGFQRERNTYSFWRAHALRKYFISIIINKTSSKIFADYMAGHKINKQDRTYWQVNPDDLKKHYLEVLPSLSLDQEKLKELKTMYSQKNLNNSKYEEIAALAHELAEIKERFEERNKLLDEILTDPNLLKKINDRNQE
ncbi:MAG: tyrosine-type recombinase/integrase [Methanobacterium sp. ERen5]|nr:MAG: tyrosine-type recombinase/integrase [Methanobacterium sp. ERen5]